MPVWCCIHSMDQSKIGNPHCTTNSRALKIQQSNSTYWTTHIMPPNTMEHFFSVWHRARFADYLQFSKLYILKYIAYVDRSNILFVLCVCVWSTMSQRFSILYSIETFQYQFLVVNYLQLKFTNHVPISPSHSLFL